LLQRKKEYDRFNQTEWLSTAIHSSEAITWNPLLLDICATAFNIVIPVIASMAIPHKSRGNPVICECRIYPKAHNQTYTRISATTFIRKDLETYVGAVQCKAF
jgi:hypothetical protein